MKNQSLSRWMSNPDFTTSSTSYLPLCCPRSSSPLPSVPCVCLVSKIDSFSSLPPPGGGGVLVTGPPLLTQSIQLPLYSPIFVYLRTQERSHMLAPTHYHIDSKPSFTQIKKYRGRGGWWEEKSKLHVPCFPRKSYSRLTPHASLAEKYHFLVHRGFREGEAFAEFVCREKEGVWMGDDGEVVRGGDRVATEFVGFADVDNGGRGRGRRGLDSTENLGARY